MSSLWYIPKMALERKVLGEPFLVWTALFLRGFFRLGCFTILCPENKGKVLTWLWKLFNKQRNTASSFQRNRKASFSQPASGGARTQGKGVSSSCFENRKPPLFGSLLFYWRLSVHYNAAHVAAFIIHFGDSINEIMSPILKGKKKKGQSTQHYNILSSVILGALSILGLWS